MCHTVLRPDDLLLRAPVAGILLEVDPANTRFFIGGKQPVALWLHDREGRPLPTADIKFLPLANAGAPLQAGQLLGRQQSLPYGTFTPLLSLLTPVSEGFCAVCHTGRRRGGRSPLLTFERLSRRRF
ncbi:MAG: hypothetical protein IJY22_03620 [Clostridia bacterium]|nr:hypothetical protein [Clostridia bacterium]